MSSKSNSKASKKVISQSDKAAYNNRCNQMNPNNKAYWSSRAGNKKR